MSRRVLVAGIGNIFQSDDGFGVEVVSRLGRHALPAGVRVEDYGIRGVHLAYELLDGYDALVMVDALPMHEPPGTLVVMEPALAASPDDATPIDAHTMSPTVVLATLTRLGGRIEQIYVVGCQPATLDEGMSLSDPVAAAIEDAVEMCVQLVDEIVNRDISNREILQPETVEFAGKGTPS